MGEQFPAVTLPVTPGMRDDIEPQAAPVGTITRARNVRFPRAGVVQPRWGLARLTVVSDAATPYGGNPDFLHPCRDGFVFGKGGVGYRYDATSGKTMAAGSYSTAQPRGKLDVSAREELTLLSGSDGQHITPWPLSTAVSGSLVATCHAVGNGQAVGGFGRLGLQRDGTDPSGPVAGATVRIFSHAGELVASHYFVNMVSAAVIDDALGTLKVVHQTNLTELRVVDVQADGQVPGPSVLIGTLSSGASYWAACRWPGVGWAVVWQTSSTTLTVQKMVGVAAVGAPVVIAIPTTGGGPPVSIYADAVNLWVGWVQPGAGARDARAQIHNVAMAVVVPQFTVRPLAAADPGFLGPPLFGPIAGGVLALVGKAVKQRPDVGETDTIAYTITPGGVVTAGAVQHTLLPLSAPFGDGLWWARHATRSPTGIQTMRSVLLDFYELTGYPKLALVGEQVTFADKANNMGACLYLTHLHTPVQLAGGDWVMGVPRLVRQEIAPSPTGSFYLALAEWLRFVTVSEQQTKTVGEDVLAGGSLVSIDSGLGTYAQGAGGKALSSQGLDVGMLQMPSIAQLVSSTIAGGGLTLLGEYQYRAVIELIDARGRRWRSAPTSVSKSTLTGTSNAITVIVNAWLPILRGFSLPPVTSRLVVHIYRSPANGFNFQRVTPAQGAPVLHTAATFSYVDVSSDALIASREFLYTDGGVLQNDHPPSCRFVADTEDRVWLGGLWDPNIIQSSKTIVPGEGIAFSDLDAFKVDLKEPNTGLAAQDGILFAFTASRIYAIQGLGPNQQGQGAWDDAKREISRSTGCIDWRSIVETTAGVFYQSTRGIMLVPRGGGEPQFIGAPVQKILVELGGVISSAGVCQGRDGATARFCCGLGTLIFDLVTSAWSYDVPPAGARHVKVCDTEHGPVLARETTFFDLEVRAPVSGPVITPADLGSVTDDGAPIESFVSWAPVRPGGLAGWGTFVSAIGVFGKLEGLPYPATALTFSAVVDNDASGTATRPTMADFQTIDYRRLALRNRQGCAASLSFTTAGAPWRFVGWTVETLDLDGPRRTPPGEYI